MTTIDAPLRGERAIAAAGPRGRLEFPRWARRLLNEPLLHFLLAGFVLFVAADAYRQIHDTYRIDITPERGGKPRTLLSGSVRDDPFTGGEGGHDRSVCR